jgi:hypothetical protein
MKNQLPLALNPLAPDVNGRIPDPKAGNWWYTPWLLDEVPSRFSTEYMRDWLGKRPPIVIALPTGVKGGWWAWEIDTPFINGAPGQGWVIRGMAPFLTATPSIGVPSMLPGKWRWHGWLKNGVLEELSEENPDKPW